MIVDNDGDAWIMAGPHTGVQKLRAFVTGGRKDAAAGRAGLSLLWRHGPTAGFVHRLTLLKRPAYGRAGVDCLRHRMRATFPGEAA
jgi:transposase